jgi:hypothetical protein
VILGNKFYFTKVRVKKSIFIKEKAKIKIVNKKLQHECWSFEYLENSERITS